MKPQGGVASVAVGGLLFLVAATSEPSRAHALQTDQVSAIQQEAIGFYRAGQYDRAAKRYRQLLALQPGNVELLKDLMWVSWHAKRFEEVMKVAEQVLAHAADDAEVWKLMGNAQMALGRNTEAIQAFERSLLFNPDQLSVSRLIAQLWLDLRQYDAATALLVQLAQRYPEEPTLTPLLARAQTLQGAFAEAAQSWAKARAAFPDLLAYHYQEAAALYQSGQRDQALAALTALTGRHPDYGPAMEFLVAHAMVNGDLAGVARLLERQLDKPIPGDEPRLLKLANVYHRLGETTVYLKTLDRCLRLNPSYSEALLLKAEQFKRTGRLAKAARSYRQLLALSPWSLRALTGLADAQALRGRYAQATQLMARVRSLDPHDPHLLLNHAKLLYAQGQRRTSKQLLTRWLDVNRGPVVFVLVYHGLATSPDDPMLASPVHMTVEAFADQMRGLREGGFSPVTAEEVAAWYHGTLELPDRPVLITFDDARLDSFHHADPILERYGLKATMFVPIVNVKRNLPGYASWEEIVRYRQTGRWEIQSHGADAASFIPIDAEGRQGLFLVNRRWLADAQRLETPQEWAARIAADYRLGQLTIARQLGKAPVAFAYPEGNFGQEGVPNADDAARVNLELARRVFSVAYHQDLYGVNVRSDDPMLLTRLEPSAAWTGADLVRHVTHNTPFVRMHLALLRHAMWQGRFREAQRWLGAFRHDGVSPSLVLIEEARMRFASGDPITGRDMAARALATDRTPETAQLARAVQGGETGWVWTPSVSFQEDNRDREHLLAQQQLESWRMGPRLWRVRHRSGLFREAGIEEVMDHGAGLGTTVPLGLFHQVDVDAMGHLFTGEAGETVTASGALRSRWIDGLTTALEAGQALVETARALQAGVRDRYVSFKTVWTGEGLWRASAQARAADLSDDNRRTTSTVELSRGVGFLPPLRMVYRFTADDTEAPSPHYYSPRRLFLHQLGAEYRLPLWKGSVLSLRYLPGYGQEAGSNARLIHTLEIAAPVNQQGRFRLRPSLFITRTPTFQKTAYGLTLQFRF
ncbi:MAG: tetratricopeptide repeat protein [Candidatus Omnitrophota bacterium]|nr:tetratricopeptide repeat protein [Candidatus Omnitrophota bacterium]